MTKTQINCFITVAQERSFTRAANTLYISQPAISKAVSSLEEELGVKLLERNNNSLSLTDGGELLYDFFVRTGTEYRQLIEKIEQIHGKKSAPIKIGCPDTWNPGFFYSRIKEHFINEHPEIKLSIECFRLSDLIIRLKSGKLDVVLTHDFYSPSMYGISSRNLTTTGCGIVYAKNRFPQVRTLSDFKDTEFLLFDNDIQKKIEGVIRDVCAGAFEPIVRNVGQMSSAVFSMACGEGIMLFSDWDSVVYNTAYGYYPVPRELQIKMIYSTDKKSKNIDLFLSETPKLFA